MKEYRPTPGTKEFDEWVLKRAKERNAKIFGDDPTELDEHGTLSGGPEYLSSDDDEQSHSEPKPAKSNVTPIRK